MASTLNILFSINNLYFILLMVAAIVINYLISTLLNTTRLFMEKKKPGLISIIDSISGPLLMFFLNAAYGIGYDYLSLPLSFEIYLRHSPSILLIINGLWLAYNIIPELLIKIFKALTPAKVKFIKRGLVLASLILIIILFHAHYIAILASVFVAIIFFFIAQKIAVIPKPSFAEKVVVPKRLITMHLYISTKETHDSVKQAIDLVKNSISEIQNTGENPRVSLSGFTPGAFDILIQYYIMDPERIDEIKEQVNLNIIKKLKEEKVQFSAQ